MKVPLCKFTLDVLPEKAFQGCGFPDEASNDCGFARLYPEEVKLMKKKGIWPTFRKILFIHWLDCNPSDEPVCSNKSNFDRMSRRAKMVYKIYRETEEEKVKYVPKKIEYVKPKQVVIPKVEKPKNQPKKEIPEKQVEKISYARENVIYLKRPNLRSENFPTIKCNYLEAELETVNHVIDVNGSHIIDNIDLNIKDDRGNQTLFFLFEADTIDLDIQHKVHVFLREEAILYRAVFSGNKSIHFLIKASIKNFTVTDSKTYKTIWQLIEQILILKIKNGINIDIIFDAGCANLNRLTRTPNGKRFLNGIEKKQKCLSYDKNNYTVKVPSIFLNTDEEEEEEKNYSPKNSTYKKNKKYEDNFEWVSYCDSLFIKGQRTKNLPKIVGKICKRVSLNKFLDYIDNRCDANDSDKKNLKDYATKLWIEWGKE
ncbi:MAG: hypothetical protein LBL77_00950 [Endomicrobium sp.]|jgi:hypothetical protein|nr:hypothetical protein [Endomicrobium sp.]